MSGSTNVDQCCLCQHLKVSKVNNSSARFREIRDELDLTQQELAERLLLSRNYIAQIEMGVREPSVRVVGAAEALLAKAHRANRAGAAVDIPHLKTGVPRAAQLEEPSDRYGTVASRIPQQRSPSTRADCEAYAQELFDAASLSKDPNAWPVILHRLKKQFPLEEWPEAGPESET